MAINSAGYERMRAKIQAERSLDNIDMIHMYQLQFVMCGAMEHRAARPTDGT